MKIRGFKVMKFFFFNNNDHDVNDKKKEDISKHIFK